MLSSTDIIHLPYTHDLTQAGIAYTCRWLAHTPERPSNLPIQTLRSIVAGVAVELAFRRYLAAQDVPFQNLGAAPFSDPDRFDISLGGRRVEFQTGLITRKEAIRQVRKDPASLLQALALVPSDQAASEQLADKDLWLFAFITSLVTGNRADLQRALGAGQPACCLHPLPASWAQPEQWGPLGKLAFKSECSTQIEVELGGRGADGHFLAEILSLPPLLRVTAKAEYHNLAYLQTSQLLDGRLGVRSPRLDRTHLINPFEWVNLWVYGMQVILAGYLTCGEFRRCGVHLPAGSPSFLQSRTTHASLAMPVSGLRPIAELLHSAREWSAARARPVRK